MAKQVLIIAGEASGDHHAGRMVEALKARDPEVHLRGIGGEHMRAAGVEILVDSKEMAVVGLVEVLANYRYLSGVLERMRRELRENRPDLLILVDYPDFNLRLAKTAKELGVKVLYYISPQVWAWRQKRVYKIKQLVDMMAVVFPFELPFYERAGVPARFVGHPLADEVGSELDHAQALAEFGLDPSRPVLGIFPGSRRGEIKRLLPLFLEAAAQVKQQLPEVQFILPRATTLDEGQLAPHLAASELEVTVVPGRSYDVMRACDAIISASGTATLEIALMQVPLVMAYRIAPISYWIMSRMIKIEHIALCNIVAGEGMATELLQHEARADNIAREALRLLRDEQGAATRMREKEAGILQRLGGGGAAENVAGLALELLQASE